MAAKRAQPNAEELFVEDLHRLLLESRQRVARESKARVPLDSLSYVATGQPFPDVHAIAQAHRRINTERFVRIAAEKRSPIDHRDEAAQCFCFCRRQKEKT